MVIYNFITNIIQVSETANIFDRNFTAFRGKTLFRLNI